MTKAYKAATLNSQTSQHSLAVRVATRGGRWVTQKKHTKPVTNVIFLYFSFFSLLTGEIPEDLRESRFFENASHLHCERLRVGGGTGGPFQAARVPSSRGNVALQREVTSPVEGPTRLDKLVATLQHEAP